jgi:hypothetical protein
VRSSASGARSTREGRATRLLRNDRLARARFRGTAPASGAPRPRSRKRCSLRGAHRHSWCRDASLRTVEHGVTARFVEERAARPGFREREPREARERDARDLGVQPNLSKTSTRASHRCAETIEVSRPSGECRASRRFTHFTSPCRARHRGSRPATNEAGVALTPWSSVRVARLAASDTLNRPTVPASARARVNGASLFGLECLPPTRTRTPGCRNLSVPAADSALSLACGSLQLAS